MPNREKILFKNRITEKVNFFRNSVLLTAMLSMLIGCSSTLLTQPTPVPVSLPASEPQTEVVEQIVDAGSPQKEAIPSKEQQEIIKEAPPIQTGMVFAKTVFDGVVKTSYVRLTIVDQEDETKDYQLYIGSKERQKEFPWGVQTVKPGYFFIELPMGKYKISSISIPVGTTVATEPMDINFNVDDTSVLYLGTLKVYGTRERIRLGGLPLIKPGFEYTLQILNEQKEALTEIESRFPELHKNMQVQLMKLNQDSNLINK